MIGANLLGEAPDLESPADSSQTSSSGGDAATDAPPANNTPVAVTNPVPASEARSATYYEDCMFVGDSITVGLADYQFVPASHVLASIGMSLNKISTEPIPTADGAMLALDALKAKAPKRVYIMLGSNGIAWMSPEDMAASYKTFVEAVQTELPEAKIYLLSIPPVTAAQETVAEHPITNANVDRFNSDLLALANEKGLYYVDTNTALKGNDGKLPAEIASDDGIHFKKAGYTTLTDYILSHTGE